MGHIRPMCVGAPYREQSWLHTARVWALGKLPRPRLALTDESVGDLGLVIYSYSPGHLKEFRCLQARFRLVVFTSGVRA